VKIRRACLEDVPGLVSLWVEFMDYHSALDSDFVRTLDSVEKWTSYISTQIAENAVRIFVAESEAVIVGYIVAMVESYPPIITIKNYGFIQEIAVTEKYRRRGIAHLLFETAEEWLRSVGLQRIELKIDVANELSRSFWKKEGFERHTETLIKKF